MRSSANRTSPLRRLGAAIAVALAIAAWFGAVFVWTSSDRVTTASGFTDVTVQTIQSPDGVEAARTTLLAAVNTFAAARGYDLTASSRERISEGITEALTEAQFPDLMGPAIERAREAYEAAPDGPITIDFSALRPIAVAKVGQVSPDLVKAIPPDADLTVTVQKSDVPGVASTVVGASDTLRILPLWLVLGALVLGGLALLASGNRPRMLRVLGIASLIIALVPLVLRLAVPPVAASFAEAGTGSDLVFTATSTALGHWWIALIVCLAMGVALLAAGIYAGRRQPPRRAPTVLGR
jgi:hypothetical protein